MRYVETVLGDHYLLYPSTTCCIRCDRAVFAARLGSIRRQSNICVPLSARNPSIVRWLKVEADVNTDGDTVRHQVKLENGIDDCGGDVPIQII